MSATLDLSDANLVIDDAPLDEVGLTRLWGWGLNLPRLDWRGYEDGV